MTRTFFNVVASAPLLARVARQRGGVPGSFGDAQTSASHREQVHEQLGRAPCALPRIPEVRSPFDVRAGAIAVDGHDPWPAIKAPVAV